MLVVTILFWWAWGLGYYLSYPHKNKVFTWDLGYPLYTLLWDVTVVWRIFLHRLLAVSVTVTQRHVFLHVLLCLIAFLSMATCAYLLYINIILGVYFSGDGAMRDKDGHYQITGRVDDVINTKGHRLGTAELESVMVCYNLCMCV